MFCDDYEESPMKAAWNGVETHRAMNTLHCLQEKIVEGLNDLYEAFYAAQEKIEENEVDYVRLRSASMMTRAATLAGYEQNIS